MLYEVKIYHPESGFYLNTNHESEDLEALNALLNTDAFAGPRFQIVDETGRVHFGPISRPKSEPMTVEDIAKSLGVPMLNARDLRPGERDPQGQP